MYDNDLEIDVDWASTKTWREVDRDLRGLARRRGGLDAEEAELLCDAVRLEIWLEVGAATLLEYLEATLGYGPRAAQDRVRVALELAKLPALGDALRTGELTYSAIREVTRVATARTEKVWLDAARGKTAREIEESVSGRQRGDLPTDPAKPDLRLRDVRYEVRPATLALLREAERVLADECGMRNGEWFALNTDDVRAFKRRKFM